MRVYIVKATGLGAGDARLVMQLGRSLQANGMLG